MTEITQATQNRGLRVIGIVEHFKDRKPIPEYKEVLEYVQGKYNVSYTTARSYTLAVMMRLVDRK
jgi:hypothetical protein